jgi:hypothetical protein
MAKSTTRDRDRGQWSSPTNEVRHRKLVSLTLSDACQAALNELALRLDFSRGAIVEALVTAAHDGWLISRDRLLELCAVVPGASRPRVTKKTTRKRR